MTAPVILLCFFLAFCALSVGTPLTCPLSFLNESTQQGSGRLCATLQLQTKLPCPSVNLTVRENEKLNPEKWHLESLSLKVEKTCSFMVFKQDKPSQHFPGGFSSNIPINSINTQSEFLCICEKLHIRYRRATYDDFKKRHLVDNPPEHSDKNYNSYWLEKFKQTANLRTTVPLTQTYMNRKDFNKKFTRNFPIKIHDETPNACYKESILYRSENTKDIYDVSDEARHVDKRQYCVVVALDNNGYPVHFEQTKDISQHLMQMGRRKPLQVKKVLKGNKAVLEVMPTFRTMTANGGGTVMSK
ncbi:hypothetical protein DPX16_1547 [Anabarilius grahami]|uniref:Uncharacterized protein n=1 Tax=Anabarilius grahami TaxID=495550 RepID=A0A3N0XSK4_ANAGA|nr:hypothetical protein DPX16_1547 [Anabarilius grahami]